MNRRKFLLGLVVCPSVIFGADEKEHKEKYLKIYCSHRKKLFEIPVTPSISQFLKTYECFKDLRSNKGSFIYPKLVEKLYNIQRYFGNKHLELVSGFRTKHTNKIVGGAKHSLHLLGKAADIYIPGVSISKLYKVSSRIINNDGGVGKYLKHGFVHVDVRGSRARWRS